MSEKDNLIGLTDLPATIDEFKIKKYIKGLSNFILKCDTPMTISIQGSWGSGKTSIMNMVQDEIQDKVIPVFFNTWQFSQFSLGNALPLSMLQVFLNKISNGKKEELLKKLTKYGKKGFKIFVNAAARTFSGGILENPFDTKNSPETIDLAESLEELHDSLQLAVQECCDDACKDRIVVFIDDLDRLEPSKAMELLEVLKIFFDCKKCVFVLAIDYDVVIRGAAEKYGFDLKDKKESEKGRAFFDKIIQVPFKVPVVDYNIRSYLEKGLRKIDINPNPLDMEKYQSLCTLSLGTNPRGLKRLLNAFLLLNTVRSNNNKDNDKQLLILFGLLCMQQFRENIYNLIVRVNKGVTDDNAEEALTVFARLYSKDEESLKILNLNYRTEISNDDLSSFTQFFCEFLSLIDIEPQKIAFLCDEEYQRTNEQESILSKYGENYQQLNELLKLTATTATDNSASQAKEFSVENMTDKQRARHDFWRNLQDVALNNEDFMNSGMRFPDEFKDESWLGFASGSSKVYLSIRQARRNKNCFVTYFCKKDFYQQIYPKRDEINVAIGSMLRWDDPNLDQKQISVSYEINDVPFEDKDQMQEIYQRLIVTLVKFRKVIEPYTK